MVAKLDHYEVIHRQVKSRILVNEDRARMVEEHMKATKEQAKATIERPKAIEDEAKSIATQVVEEYKDSNATEADATMVVAGIYVARLNDHKVMVTKAYPGLNLHRITMPGH